MYHPYHPGFYGSLVVYHLVATCTTNDENAGTFVTLSQPTAVTIAEDG